ncbi:MAG: alkaline phosphatase D family protein [Sumerlaeia bacterium]
MTFRNFLLLLLLAATALPAASTRAAEAQPFALQNDRLTTTPSRIAFGSGLRIDPSTGELPIWQAILAAEPDVFVFLGDNVFADTMNPSVMREAYARLAAQEGFQKLLQQATVLATWNDHDYGQNDAGKEYRMREESAAIFREFWPMPAENYGHQDHAEDEVEGKTRFPEGGVHSSHTFGDVAFILLDTRYNRDRTGRPDGRNKAILGPKQFTWLENELKSNDAKIKFVASSIQFVSDLHRFERWGKQYEFARFRLIEYIGMNGIDGVMFLSGDRNFAEISARQWGPLYPLIDVTASPMANTSEHWQAQDWKEPNESRLSEGFYRGNNFGLITIGWDQPDPPITIQIRDERGEVVYEFETNLSVLQWDPPT